MKFLFKNKIAKSLFIIGVIAAIITGVTLAFLSDTESSSGNNFMAGKLNLKVGSECSYNGDIIEGCNWITPKDLEDELFFDFDDIKPGDYGENTLKLQIDNNDAWVCGIVKNIKNDDNGCELPESDIDTSCGEDQGELGDNLFFTVWVDTDCDNILALEIPAVPEVPAHCGGGYEWSQQECIYAGEDQNYCNDLIDWGFGCVWFDYQPEIPAQPGEQILAENQKANSMLWPIADSTTNTGPITSQEDYCLGISWNVPLETDNIIQSDSVTGDIEFFAVQARHMEDFSCADYFQEICDGIDNDFDGVIDDGGVCWVSPTGNNDASWWRNDEAGRDGDMYSTTVTEWMTLGVWTDTLSYYVSPEVPSDTLRFYSTGNWGSNIEIRATVDGVSQLVYSGYNSYAWMEISLNPGGLVSQIDIRATNAYDPNFPVGTHLGEIQILRIP